MYLYPVDKRNTMRKITFFYLIIALLISAPLAGMAVEVTTTVQADESQLETGRTPAKIYRVDIKEDIGPNSWRTLSNAYAEATAQGVDAMLIELNTFGGMVNFADSMRSQILDSEIKSIVFINHNAASAGALISLAADKIYMSRGSSIGAASVVDQTGEIMPEKYQSYMRGLMRATAEANGRDPQIAEAFVDPEVDLPALKPAGKILTLTSAEAVRIGLADGELNSAMEILRAEGYETPEIIRHQITWIDQVIAWLINPAVSGVLILLIIGGIYFELQSPGVGFPLIVAIVAGVLFFAPLYMQGLADNWEIALFILGLILIALEIFVIPGFGVPGILGIFFMICGLAFSMVANDWLDFRIAAPGLLLQSFILVIVSMGIAIILMVIFGKSMLQTRAFKRLVLQDEQRSVEGYTSSRHYTDLVGKEGVTKTVMRPSGKIEIDGKWYDAVALDGYIDRDEAIYVEKHESYNLFVRKVRAM